MKNEPVECHSLPALDVNDLSDLDGERACVLIWLKELIDYCKQKDDINMQSNAEKIIKLVLEPEKYYTVVINELIQKHNEQVVQEKQYLLSKLQQPNKLIKNKEEYTLNTIERVFARQECEKIINEFKMATILFAEVDYNACKVCAELAYRCLIDRLEEKEVKSMTVNVAYNDIIADYNIIYGSGIQVYDSKAQVPWKWIALDVLYDRCIQYGNIYIGLTEDSVKCLATAYEVEQNYLKRKEGKDKVSYRGIVSDYGVVVEVELIRLIRIKMGNLNKKMTFDKAITLINEYNFFVLNKEETIDKLHKVRQIRNISSHGFTAYDKLDEIKRLLLGNKGLLRDISVELILTLKENNGELITKEELENSKISCYDMDISTPKDKEGIELYLEAAKEGDVEAQYNLAEYYYRDKNALNDKEAIKWFKKAAKQGHLESQFKVAYCYYAGRGVVQNYKKAVNWMKSAAEKGHLDAQDILGFCCENGLGTSKNVTDAIKWYTMAAEKNNASAQNNLGICYKQGIGVGKDNSQAIRWFNNAIGNGFTGAWKNLILCYEEIEGTEEEWAPLKEWLIKTAEEGDSWSQHKLGGYYLKGYRIQQNCKEGVKWLRRSAKQGVGEAQYNLALCYMEGTGVKKDMTRAANWFESAAKQGIVEAQYNLGVCYFNGEGVKQDRVKAFEWFTAAANQGYQRAKELFIK